MRIAIWLSGTITNILLLLGILSSPLNAWLVLPMLSALVCMVLGLRVCEGRGEKQVKEKKEKVDYTSTHYATNPWMKRR